MKPTRAALALFHLGNAAMLPLCGFAVIAAKRSDPNTFTAAPIVIAQRVMVAMSRQASRAAGVRGPVKVHDTFQPLSR